MSEYVLTNGIVYTENEMINNGYVHIKDGKILDVGKCPFIRHRRIIQLTLLM